MATAAPPGGGHPDGEHPDGARSGDRHVGDGAAEGADAVWGDAAAKSDDAARPAGGALPGDGAAIQGERATSSSVDPRTARTDRKIVAGALRLLREGGPQRVTIEAVSALTGVAKTSIYRRHDNSTQLLEAALEHTAAVTDVLPEDATWGQALTAAVDVLLRDMGVGVAITLLQDPDSATSRVLRATVVRPRMDALRAVLRREQQRGAIRAAVDLDMVIDFILGSAYAHLARYGSLDERWTERVHRALADQIAAPGASSPVTPGRGAASPGSSIPGPYAPGAPSADSPPREDDAARPAQKTSRSSGRCAR